MTLEQIGLLGEQETKKLYPELALTERGGVQDRLGRDGWLAGKAIQVKTDRKTAFTGNLCHEYWRKGGYPLNKEQSKNAPWRRTAQSRVDIFIFVTFDKRMGGGFMVEISHNELMEAEWGLEMGQINDTAWGMIIPLSLLWWENSSDPIRRIMRYSKAKVS